MKRFIRAAACAMLLAVSIARMPRSAAAAVVDGGSGEWNRVNRALIAGLGGAVVAYYCQRMDYRWFHRVLPARFSPQESAFLLGGWFAVLTYSGTLAALSRSGTAQAPALPLEMPLAWPVLGVDGAGHPIAGAGMRF